MKPVQTMAISILVVLAASAQAQFVGDLVLEPAGCAKTGKCILKHELRFTDSKQLVWEAAAGLETDGASIPTFFQPIVGEPFEDAFIKAAIVHDHYCNRHVRPWRATHRVFFEGLVDQGVPLAKAKLMYYAVFLGGPKWVSLIPGNACGGNCINEITTMGGKPVIRYREADYDLFAMEGELLALERELQANPDAVSLEDLERRAQEKRPNDFFYRNGDQVRMKSSAVTE